MKLYTSYFYQVRNFPPNLVGLSTVMWPPKYINLGEKDQRGILVIDCPILKPGKQCEGLCNGTCEPKHPQDCAFLQTYYKQLSQIDFNKFCQSLQNLAERIKLGENLESIDFAFIVFETPKAICSERGIIQKWLHEYNIEIEEWIKN